MNRRLWLIVSLGLNLLLAVVVVRAAKPRAPGAGESFVSERMTNRVVRVRHVTNAETPAVIAINAPFNWAQIESTDYRVYLANLRAIGCPEATIRDIIIADVNDLFAGRVREMVDGVTGRFWDFMLHPDDFQKLVEDKGHELRELEGERKELLAAIFNEDDPESKMREAENQMERRADLKQMLDFLPDEKVAQIQAIKDNIQTARREFAQANGSLTEEGRREKYKAFDAEEARQIQTLLTPQELDEYKLRTQDAANFRFQLADFDASEDELRAIARAKINPKTSDQLQQLLGPERFAAYQRASDNEYQQTLRVTDRFDLPGETAVQIYQLQKKAQSQAKKIRDDKKSHSVEERQAILTALQAESEQSVSAVLGPRVFKSYQKYAGGWLSSFADEAK